MQQSPCLRGDGRNQLRVVVPQRGNGNSRQCVEVDTTFGIGYPAAVTVAESNGKRA
jgi:hypothetical protein